MSTARNSDNPNVPQHFMIEAGNTKTPRQSTVSET